MNEKLEKYINLALADGVLTDKERKLLQKKAQELGVDQDEFEFVLEAKIHLAKKDDVPPSPLQNASEPEKAKSQKEGETRKCPSCGAPALSFATECSDCGHEFRNTDASKSVKEFFIAINNAPLKHHASIINNFPVPNNKEDIFEFLAMSIGNCSDLSDDEKKTYIKNSWLETYEPELGYKQAEIRAWQSKVQAIIQKGKISFTDESSRSKIIDFENQYSRVTKANKWRKSKSNLILAGITIVFLGFMIPIFVGMSSDHEKGVAKEKARLEKVMDKVTKNIDNKNYETALILASGLKWEYSDDWNNETDKLEKAWDEKRESLIESIKEANRQSK